MAATAVLSRSASRSAPLNELYCAERNGWDFSAASPTALLGLIAIFEATDPQHYSEYWWRQSSPWLFDNVGAHPATDYVPVYRQ